jgi:RimJ/RimL family protein N-acetyltransferase
MAQDGPWTKTEISEPERERMREVIRSAVRVAGTYTRGRVVEMEDADALAALFNEPSIGGAIYTLPYPATRESAEAFIDDHLEQRSRGEGILFASFADDGAATGYFDAELWEQWGAVKFGGAVTANRQNRGFGALGALACIEWCMDVLGVQRLCQTTAPDNHRSIRMMVNMGFVQVGEMLSVRPDGSTRPSLCWEMDQEIWRRLREGKRAG